MAPERARATAKLSGWSWLPLTCYTSYCTWPKRIISTHIQILTPLNITWPSQLRPREGKKKEKRTFLLRRSSLQRLLGSQKPLLRLKASIKDLSRICRKRAKCSSVQAGKRTERQIGVVNNLSRAVFLETRNCLQAPREHHLHKTITTLITKRFHLSIETGTCRTWQTFVHRFRGCPSLRRGIWAG